MCFNCTVNVGWCESIWLVGGNSDFACYYYLFFSSSSFDSIALNWKLTKKKVKWKSNSIDSSKSVCSSNSQHTAIHKYTNANHCYSTFVHVLYYLSVRQFGWVPSVLKNSCSICVFWGAVNNNERKKLLSRTYCDRIDRFFFSSTLAIVNCEQSILCLWQWFRFIRFGGIRFVCVCSSVWCVNHLKTCGSMLVNEPNVKNHKISF